MKRSEMEKRDAEMADRYLTKRYSLRDIGEMYGLDHERVRQIFERDRVPIRPWGRHVERRKP